MQEVPLVNVNASTAVEICRHFYLSGEGRQCLREDMGPREFAKALLANKRFIEGIDFVAHALPVRVSVWWGCLCFQHTSGDRFTAHEMAACRAAVQWVLQPTEENRMAAKAPAEITVLPTVAGALASAVYQAGGNASPSGAPPQPSDAFAYAKAVAMAVKLASMKGEPVGMAERQRQFVELGMSVAEGRYCDYL